MDNGDPVSVDEVEPPPESTLASLVLLVSDLWKVVPDLLSVPQLLRRTLVLHVSALVRVLHEALSVFVEPVLREEGRGGNEKYREGGREEDTQRKCVRERGSLEKRECVCEKKRSEEVDGERKMRERKRGMMYITS